MSDAPKDFQSLRTALVERQQELPRRLSQVAAFALENPDEIAFGTVASIASQADVQPSALVRFAQALGYDGFSDMQRVFRSRLREGGADYRDRLEALKSREEIAGAVGLLDGFCEAASFSIARMRQQVDPVAFEASVARLASAQTIYLVGLRRSFPVASYLAYALSQIGIRNVLVDNVGSLAPESLRFAGPTDAAICISFTPYAPATLDLAAQVASQGVAVVSITDSPLSPLARLSDSHVEIVEADFGGFRSTAATFAYALSLAVAVGERRRRAGP